MSRTFNEATRVQMPALVHLCRIGYEYFGKILEETANKDYDPDTNILIKVFKTQFEKLNPDHAGEALQVLHDIRQELDNDDLGRSFYSRLTSASPTRIIDFENPKNNIYHCTAEFTCKRDHDEFRPDITLFINGLPLAFIEVKKPNNRGGMLAESQRMNNVRFPNKKFRRFINVTQLMIFSNNMEYDTDGGIVPIQGVFYCTASKEKSFFNCFREENIGNQPIATYNRDYSYKNIDPSIEKRILSDFNCQVIHTAPEYQTNLDINTPTNRVITSMCSPERLLFLIKYGIAYVRMEREIDGKIESVNEKHIMRYQQMFAALAIRSKLKENVKSGVIWHTQGSGKTALSYYLTSVLSDYLASLNKVAKFYFIVDRLDLLEQATQEFEARGLEVKTANTRNELMSQFKVTQALQGKSGKPEITVVNIQRFAEDKDKVSVPPYATNLQRIFVVDEAHRGYNPKGCFLANLFDADPESIKIALTGTPLLKEERASWKVFGNYLHTYYYDQSIQDGYTLKIIREEIETKYREKLNEIYEKLETLVQKKDIKKAEIIEHETYVKELLRFIIQDLREFRIVKGEDTLGGMVICETSEQARQLFKFFNEIQDDLNNNSNRETNFKAGLILYDSDDKETRKQIVKDFKKNMTIDILIVYNMLLTGFDAPRLKRLYFGRKLKDHNLLQALTRVNRPYKDNRYGYVIDFADIKRNFDQTNEAYLRELSRFCDPDETGISDLPDTVKAILEDKDSLIKHIKDTQNVLFDYTTNNTEIFSQEISDIEDKDKLIELKKILIDVRDCYNVVRTFGDDELKNVFNHLEIRNIPDMISEIQHRINILNQKETFEKYDGLHEIVFDALKDIEFKFDRKGEEEMNLVSGGGELKEKWGQAIRKFSENTDQDDPEFITLREAFMQRFKEHGFVVDSLNELEEHTKALDEIIKKLIELQKKNNALSRKYNDDVKFARVHKRIREENIKRKSLGQEPVISENEVSICNMLKEIKSDIDIKVYDRNDILKKDAYFEQTVMSLIKTGMDRLDISSNREDRVFIRTKIAKEYLNQYNALYPAA